MSREVGFRGVRREETQRVLVHEGFSPLGFRKARPGRFDRGEGSRRKHKTRFAGTRHTYKALHTHTKVPKAMTVDATGRLRDSTGKLTDALCSCVHPICRPERLCQRLRRVCLGGGMIYEEANSFEPVPNPYHHSTSVRPLRVYKYYSSPLFFSSL